MSDEPSREKRIANINDKLRKSLVTRGHCLREHSTSIDRWAFFVLHFN
jgi:hypothetical protein